MVVNRKFGAIQKRYAYLYVVAYTIAKAEAIDWLLQNVRQDRCEEKPQGSQVFFHALTQSQNRER